MPKTTLKKYTYDGVMRPKRTCKVTSGPVNSSVSFVPSAFEKGRTVVSQASGYVLGRQRGRGTRKGCGHINPGKMSSGPDIYGPDMCRTRSGNLSGVRLSSRDAASERNEKRAAILAQAKRNREIRKSGVLS